MVCQKSKILCPEALSQGLPEATGRMLFPFSNNKSKNRKEHKENETNHDGIDIRDHCIRGLSIIKKEWSYYLRNEYKSCKDPEPLYNQANLFHNPIVLVVRFQTEAEDGATTSPMSRRCPE
jgi:hypothetical protein